MDIFGQIADKIIKGQEMIIGPVALEQAMKVPGLSVDDAKKEIKISGDKKKVLENLIGKYEQLFGKASIEVCRDAVRDLLPKLPQDQVPSLLAH